MFQCHPVTAIIYTAFFHNILTESISQRSPNSSHGEAMNKVYLTMVVTEEQGNQSKTHVQHGEHAVCVSARGELM